MTWYVKPINEIPLKIENKGNLFWAKMKVLKNTTKPVISTSYLALYNLFVLVPFLNFVSKVFHVTVLMPSGGFNIIRWERKKITIPLMVNIQCFIRKGS